MSPIFCNLRKNVLTFARHVVASPHICAISHLQQPHYSDKEISSALSSPSDSESNEEFEGLFFAEEGEKCAPS